MPPFSTRALGCASVRTEALHQISRNRSRLSASDISPVVGTDRRDLARRAGEEGFVGGVDIEAIQHVLPHRVARLARVADPEGSTEVILFYMEAADREFPTRPLPMADEDGDIPLAEADAKSLLERLKSVMTAVSG